MKNILKILLLLSIVSFTGLKTTYAQVSVGVSITIPPPELVVYSQPPCPVDGYLWCPGYWAYGPDGYYWVPGVWVMPPTVGYLWTPGYWGFEGGYYGWHAGYWGPHIGFYGGVNYGYGYGGVGFVGGMWQGGHFRYNTAVVNVNTTVVHNTYINRTVINNTSINRTSFNGPGGIAARPSPQEQIAMNEHHVRVTPQQVSHERTARVDRNQLASVNHGRPATVAMNSVGGRHFDQQGHNVASVHTMPANRNTSANTRASVTTRQPNMVHNNTNHPQVTHPNNNMQRQPQSQVHVQQPQHFSHPQNPERGRGGERH